MGRKNSFFFLSSRVRDIFYDNFEFQGDFFAAQNGTFPEAYLTTPSEKYKYVLPSWNFLSVSSAHRTFEAFPILGQKLEMAGGTNEFISYQAFFSQRNLPDRLDHCSLLESLSLYLSLTLSAKEDIGICFLFSQVPFPALSRVYKTANPSRFRRDYFCSYIKSAEVILLLSALYSGKSNPARKVSRKQM